MKKYDYLLDASGRVIVTKDYHDIYVELQVEGKSFYVPVSLPRRRPELQFDLSNPGDDLWTHLDNCEKQLLGEKVAIWKEEQLKKLEGKKTVTDRLLISLIEQGSVCCACFFSGDYYNPNPQKNIQNLRDKGFVIVTHRGVQCSKCGQRKARYTLTPVLMNQKYFVETIPPKLKRKICELFDFRDAYTGIQNPNAETHIPDHKFPEDRWDTDTAVKNDVDMSISEIQEKFQLLNAQTNMQKKQACGDCIRTGKRGYPFGIKYYYAGTEDWDKDIPTRGKAAETGCIGCGWYDMLKWKEELNKKLNK